jgi:hypothetical protein
MESLRNPHRIPPRVLNSPNQLTARRLRLLRGMTARARTSRTRVINRGYSCDNVVRKGRRRAPRQGI